MRSQNLDILHIACTDCWLAAGKGFAILYLTAASCAAAALADILGAFNPSHHILYNIVLMTADRAGLRQSDRLSVQQAQERYNATTRIGLVRRA